MIGRVRLLVVGDAHIAAADTPSQRWHNEFAFADSEQLLARTLGSATALNADLAAVLGDVFNSPGERLPRGLAALRAPAGTELRLVCGNEDPPALRSHVPSDTLASLAGELLGSWLRLAGMQVASSDGGASAEAIDSPPTDSWGEDTVALLSHFPLLSRASEFAARGLPYAGDLLNRPEWSEALLARSVPTVVLCGHLHARDAATAGRVLQIGCGALIEAPHEFSVIDFEPGNGYPRVRRRTHELGEALPPVDPALAPRSEEWAFDGDCWQSVEAAVGRRQRVVATN